MAGARMALCAQKFWRVKNPARRWRAPDKSDQLSRLVARARGRCLAANSVTPAIGSVGGESAETMIPPPSRSGGELVHIARSIRNHFARSLDRRARTKIAATEVSRQAAPTTEGEIDRCAGKWTIYILPRRDDVKIPARLAQLYRGKRPTSKRMDRLYEGL